MPASASMQGFCIAGCELRWVAEQPALAERFVRACCANLIFSDPNETPAVLTVRLVSNAPQLPEHCTDLSRSPRLQVVKSEADGRVFLGFDDCTAVIADGQCEADFWMSEAFDQLPLKEQQIRLTLLMVWLLQSQGLSALHGATLVQSGQAIVLTGISGAGKSTTALSLASGGWALCADDISLLDCRTATPRIWPLARGLSAAAGTVAKMPGWRLLDATVITGKQLLERDDSLDYQTAPLAALYFPQVDADAPSQLLPVRGAEALIKLLPGIGGILTGLPSANGRLQELAQLCATLPCFTLRLGRDVYQNPSALTALVSPPCGESI